MPRSTLHAQFITYRQIFSAGIQNTFVYRWNFLLRTVFGIVPLVGMLFIWRAIFESKGGAINGYEYSSMIFYFMLVVFVDNLPRNAMGKVQRIDLKQFIGRQTNG